MGRPAGSRNEGYDARRDALAAAVVPRLMDDDGPQASLAELAAFAGVSVPTMKHYFSDRSGLVAAALRSLATSGVPHVERTKTPSQPTFAASMRDLAVELAMAWRSFGVGRAFGAALAVGIHDREVGRGTVEGVLEPTLQAIEARIAVHVERRDVDVHPNEIRLCAIQFLSPLVVALLHQHELSGAACRPLDIDAFVDAHVDRFLRAWAR
jgi:AcrR family transcriptional regulator